MQHILVCLSLIIHFPSFFIFWMQYTTVDYYLFSLSLSLSLSPFSACIYVSLFLSPRRRKCFQLDEIRFMQVEIHLCISNFCIGITSPSLRFYLPASVSLSLFRCLSVSLSRCLSLFLSLFHESGNISLYLHLLSPSLFLSLCLADSLSLSPRKRKCFQ